MYIDIHSHLDHPLIYEKLDAIIENARKAGLKHIVTNGINPETNRICLELSKKYGIVEVLSGHGVGRAIHEDPYIPNFGKAGKGEKLVPGMVIALEPMINLGTKNVTIDDDGYTFRTADGKPSAHFEHTILIIEGEAEILTSP